MSMDSAIHHVQGAWQALSDRLGLASAEGDEIAAPWARTNLGRLFWKAPRPLIHPGARMVVIFSAKSACTSVVIWFLHQLGQAAAARDYSHWPHRYRSKVYYRGPVYRSAFDHDLENFAVVRVVRDPFDRTVSSFRHALRTRLADRYIPGVLHRWNVSKDGLSFDEFLDFLEHSDLTTCNTHFRIQRHPLEDELPVRHLINVSTEDLFTRLNEVETDLGLPHTDFAELQWLHQADERRTRRERRRRAGARHPDVTDPYTHRFTQDQAREGPWPSYSAFLTPEARERIARLYAVDLESYMKPAAADGKTGSTADRGEPKRLGRLEPENISARQPFSRKLVV